ncbi:hypothetical protein DQW50_09175 [Halorubrum sp. 48-1-W]|uniref:Vms1/Ankzf1 family peptidyl-tRNA hydrolase n=1 Tax=Halorubrum sp. 48-1-W TaxID=2249761 RepID=UPI000DCB0621|nr:Vms1/Ankzf1 family peptidyl-tRNA hydrolase [Halorubrum sp. 48-1-W]RAW45500.1 hypothetical protein DQW50_09175 [Halorubrum sp. 48-1-W]
MIDRLLGRAELKERIAELEEEKRHLERRAEAEEERRSDAVADRQRAEERVNRLEARIESLEDRVERAEGDEETVEFRRVSDASGSRLADVLDRLRGVESDDPEGVLTAFVPDGAVPESVGEHFGDRTRLVRRTVPSVVVADDTGAVSAALSTPIEPEPFDRWADRAYLPDESFRPAGRFAFALVRSDTFACGIYEDDDRVDFEGFTSDVMGAHSKGGFSQGRFERRRDGQIDDHLERARDALVDLVDAAGDVDRTIVVGERSVLGELRDLADHTDVSDATGRPEEALEDAFRDFWTVRIHAI